MALSKKQKRLLIILSILIGIFLVVVITINQVLSTVLEARINAAFAKNKTEYKISIDGVGGNIFFGNIRLKGLDLKPDSIMLSQLKAGQIESGRVIDVEVPVFRIAGIGVWEAIVNGNIDIRKIEIKRAKITIYQGDKAENIQPDTVLHQPLKFNVDSIYLEGISGFSLGRIILEKNEFAIYDVRKERVILKNEIKELEIANFFVKKREDLANVFRLDAREAKLLLEDEVFHIPGDKYVLKVGKLEFYRADSSMVIRNLELRPLLNDKYKMAKKYKYTQEIFNFGIEQINVYAIGVYDLVRKDRLFVDSVNVDGIDLAIFKDKRYPFDESKRPKLPHQSLKAMKMPIYLHAVNLRNGRLLYEEKEEGADELMTVKLSELNANIQFVTSDPDSMRTGKSMKIGLSARLMEKPRLKVDLVLPLNSPVDTFYYAGSLGSANLSIFNSASLPAIGVKFIDGKLKSLNFKGGANPTVSKGEMTMLYDGLAAEVVKKDQQSKNKFLSWAANAVLKTSNPGKNGKTRVVVIGFERVMYKGLGNFLWKTLQTGITSTITPTGKQVKDEKPKSSKDTSDKQEITTPEEEKDTKKQSRKKKKRKEKKKK